MLMLMLGIFLVSLVSSSTGIYTQGQDINLIQTCADCTFINITSVIAPDGTRLISNIEMTQDGTTYNYTLAGSLTESLGEYKVNGIGNPLGINEIWSYTFDVTVNGQNFSTGKSISYIGFIIILLFIFFLTCYGAIKVRWEHRKSDGGKILTVNNFRYAKIFLFTIAYFELMFLFGLSYKFFNEANIQGFPEFFNFIYQWFLNLIYPLMVFLIIVIFVIWINNKKLNKRLKLGL